MNLTILEKDIIVAIAEDEYNDCVPNCPIWTWNISSNAKITKKEQLCGVISSLVKKGLVGTDNVDINENDHCTWLTVGGFEIYNKIKED